jgi:hypothetical protein
MRKPGWLAGLFSLYFYCMELSETKMPTLTDLFFWSQVSDSGLVIGFCDAGF